MKFSRNSKPALAFQEGILKETKKKNTELINDMNIISNLKQMSAKKQSISVFAAEKKEEERNKNYLLITSKMIRTVYVVNKLSLPFVDHKSVVDLQKLNGLDMGHHHYGRTGCNDMTIHISKHVHKILIENLIQSKMPISVIVDDATDTGNVHYKIVYFQTIEDFSPVIYFYRLIETIPETGLAGFESLKLAWQSEEKKDFYEYMRNNLIGFASDGAPTNVGSLSGTIKFLKVWAKNLIFAIHCMAHRLELTVNHAFEVMTNRENMNKINEYLDKTISKTYSFYNGYGHKRKNHLKQTFVHV